VRRLGGDAEVNALVGAALREVPSHKFLPLVYQVASRLSAARAGPLVESGFQANLAALLVRLGREHPHHSLYQVFSLKNGNRGRDGRVADPQATAALSYAGERGVAAQYRPRREAVGQLGCCLLALSEFGLWGATHRVCLNGGWRAHTLTQLSPSPGPPPPVDLDKVAAAQEVLDRVAAHSQGCGAVVREMAELIDAYIELAATPPPKDAEEMAFPGGLRRSRQ
jgi:hypothetical protein